MRLLCWRCLDTAASAFPTAKHAHTKNTQLVRGNAQERKAISHRGANENFCDVLQPHASPWVLANTKMVFLRIEQIPDLFQVHLNVGNLNSELHVGRGCLDGGEYLCDDSWHNAITLGPHKHSIVIMNASECMAESESVCAVGLAAMQIDDVQAGLMSSYPMPRLRIAGPSLCGFSHFQFDHTQTPCCKRRGAEPVMNMEHDTNKRTVANQLKPLMASSTTGFAANSYTSNCVESMSNTRSKEKELLHTGLEAEQQIKGTLTAPHGPCVS
jgi:hypothetical protein